MAEQTNTPVLSVDDAYSQFKSAEATYNSDNTALGTALATLQAAQAQVTASQSTVSVDTQAALSAAQNLQTALTAYITALQQPSTPPTP